MSPAAAETLVVGDGLTAVFVAGILEYLWGERTLLVPPPGMPPGVTTLRPHSLPVPMPVFPLAVHTPLSALLSMVTVWPPTGFDPTAGVLDVSIGYPEAVDQSPVLQGCVRPGSYAEHATGVSLSQACKQFGQSLCTTRPLSELRLKVARHYSSSAQAPARIGFIDGESAYNGAARDVRSRLTALRGTCERIDVAERIVCLADGDRLKYGRLVYCAPLASLGRCLGLPIGNPIGAPASFMRCHVRDTLPVNSLRYDYRPDSPILRVFVPTLGSLVAQLAIDCDPTRGGREIGAWLESLMNCDVKVTDDPVTHIEGAYPLDPLPEGPAGSIRDACHTGNIIRFGRHAEWRYLDLHELDWLSLKRPQ